MSYQKLTTIPPGTYMEINTDAGMSAVLTTSNLGKCYKFTGATGTYTNGDLYVVKSTPDTQLIPDMTSNTTPYGTCATIGNYDENPAYYCFDGNTGTYSKNEHENTEWGGVQYTFQSTVTLNRLIAKANNIYSNSDTFTFYYLDTSDTWVQFGSSFSVSGSTAQDYDTGVLTSVQAKAIKWIGTGNKVYLHQVYTYEIYAYGPGEFEHYPSGGTIGSGSYIFRHYGEEAQALIPTMTSDTSDVVSLSGNGYYGSRYYYLGFDGDDDTSFHGRSGGYPSYIVLTFTDTHTFDHFEMLPTTSQYDMTAQIQGSNDNSTYVDLVASQNYPTGVSTTVQSLDKTTAYKYLRIYFTTGGYGCALLATFQAYGK